MTDDARSVGLTSNLTAALKVGAASGGIGFLIGSTAGILRGATPVVFGISSSLQCALLGSSFWAVRGTLLPPTPGVERSGGELTQASAMAGAFSGGLTGLAFRGPRVFLTRSIAMAGLGAGGQMLVNFWQRAPTTPSNGRTLWKSMTQNAWSPLQTLSNEEYAEMLKEKLLRVEVEISILDDKIAALKKEQLTSNDSAKDADQR